MISFRKLTALPYVCLGCSLLFHLGDEVRFLGDTGGSCLLTQANIFRLGLVFSADCTETYSISQAHIHWLEIQCGLLSASQLQGCQNKPAIGAFSNLHRLLRMLVG